MRASKKTELARWIAEHKPNLIGQSEQQAISAALAPVSPGYLRHLLRECGVPLDPQVEGVRQETFDSLERSLVALAVAYESADREIQRAVRTLVIEAKDHAKLAAQRTGTDSPKHEMILWMLTWLENPPLFPQWVKLRKHAQAAPEEGKDAEDA